MKTTKNNNGSQQLPSRFRMPCMLAILLCAGVSARASLALENNLQSLQAQQNLNQLSTGLQINSGNDNPSDNNPYTWLEAQQGVYSLSYNSLSQANQQPQQLLQLLQDANEDPIQSGISQLAQANQQQLSSVQSLQQASSLQQSVLQLFSGNAQQSLSLASQSLQTTASSLQQASPVPSAVSLVQANQLNQLSTGLRINQAADPAQLTVSTQNGLTVQLNQQNDGYDNSQGLNAQGLSVNNVSLQALLTDPVSQQALQNPLKSGDLVSVGQLSQDQALTFFQMAQSVNGTSLQLLGQPDMTGVGDQFSTSVVALKNLNSPYIFISIADQSGLDAQDYNGAVLAINIGQANVHALFAAPEPSLYLTLSGFLALAIWAKRRMDRIQTTSVN